MISCTVSVLFLFLSCGFYVPALAQQQAQFNQVLNINGDMDLNSFEFPDRSKVETFSQTQGQLIVNQNTPPVPPNQVTGSTGQPFVALMPQSMSINTNGADDLVGGQIELAMDPQMLEQNAVNPDNTYVGQLSPDRQTWMIMEPLRSVNITDMTIRVQKRTSIDGEYIALGRQTVETSNVLVPFGTDQANSVVIQGTGLQENEFVDGFRMSVRATQPVTMTVDVKDGVEQGMLTQLQDQMTLNDFRYSVVTNLAGVQPDLNRMVTVVQLPINAVRVQKIMQSMGILPDGQVQIGVAQRGVLQNPGGATGQLQGIAQAPPQRRGRGEFRREILKRQTNGGTPTQPQSNNPVATELLLEPTFTPVQADAVFDPLNMRIAIPVPQVDGEYIITMKNAGAAPQPEAAQQPEATQQPEPSGQPAPEAQAPPNPSEAARPINGTGSAATETTKAEPAEPEESTTKLERRQEKSNEPPKGSVLIAMKEVNQMVELQKWGGQVPITEMMTKYVKENTGKK
ncbi:hypothetical protein CC78DRAFT_615284 [Lojkania enalia]|uniref:Uncharacterized protein n=1 Tax=Lojkania enalia TaxID=147567 RepID=A0A9P4KCT2_9PLEO|nr:hypothetical protein CC78DRAFT_615284 [Didymosphaeria enalia]